MTLHLCLASFPQAYIDYELQRNAWFAENVLFQKKNYNDAANMTPQERANWRTWSDRYMSKPGWPASLFGIRVVDWSKVRSHEIQTPRKTNTDIWLYRFVICCVEAIACSKDPVVTTHVTFAVVCLTYRLYSAASSRILITVYTT
jgi:hypothetical protein